VMPGIEGKRDMARMLDRLRAQPAKTIAGLAVTGHPACPRRAAVPARLTAAAAARSETDQGQQGGDGGRVRERTRRSTRRDTTQTQHRRINGG